ncbi:MAG: hypothetical protein PHZ23_14600 [Acidiphilium sp.]|nr:hypothetical protein [Acidiphilium sp.]
MSTDLKIGDRVRDNDPRCDQHVGVVQRISDGMATIGRDGRGKTRVSVIRIFTDGKPRRSGWSRIEPTECGE